MLYDIREYTKQFSPETNASLETKAQADKDMGLAGIIIILLNEKKYDSLEDFIKRNSTYQDFLKNNNYDTVVQHFGMYNKNKITEENFIRVLSNLRQLTSTMQSYNKENIKTTNIGNEQYITYKSEDKTYFIDNSRTDKTIEEQMRDLQPIQQDFQTSDQKKNTENMFKELERKKEGLNLNYLNEINYDLLNNEEKLLFQIAKNYQQGINGTIRVDLKKGIIIDEFDSIMKIEETDGEFTITKNENDVEKEEKTTTKTFQKTLKTSPNTIYSN